MHKYKHVFHSFEYVSKRMMPIIITFNPSGKDFNKPQKLPKNRNQRANEFKTFRLIPRPRNIFKASPLARIEFASVLGGLETGYQSYTVGPNLRIPLLGVGAICRGKLMIARIFNSIQSREVNKQGSEKICRIINSGIEDEKRICRT